MKLIVSGGGGEFSVQIAGTEHVAKISKGITAYEACHELARWLEDVTENVVEISFQDEAPETQPGPSASAPPVQLPQAESLDHGSPGAKFGSPGVTDWLDAGRPDFTKQEPAPAAVIQLPAVAAPALVVVPEPVAPAPTQDAPQGRGSTFDGTITNIGSTPAAVDVAPQDAGASAPADPKGAA